MATTPDNKTTNELLSKLTKALETRDRFEDSYFSALQKHAKDLERRSSKLNDILDNLATNIGKAGADIKKDLRLVSEKMIEVSDNRVISNAQLDKATKKAKEELTGLVNGLTNVHPEMKKLLEGLIKNTQTFDDLQKNTEAFSRAAQQYNQIQENFGNSISDVEKSLFRLGFSTEEVSQKINKAKIAEYKNLIREANLKGKNTKDEKVKQSLLLKANRLVSQNIANQTDVKDRAKELAETLERATLAVGKHSQGLLDLSKKAIQPFIKYVDDSKASIVASTKEYLTVAWAAKKMWQGLTQAYQEFVKLNSIGLAGTFNNLQWTAMKFQVSLETLSKITDLNRVIMYRDAINGTKTFNQAQTDFLSQTKKIADQGIIERLGRNEGMLASAGMIGNVRFGGINKLEDIDDISSKLGKNFLLLNSTLGITGDQFVSELNSLRDLESTQYALIVANKEQKKAILDTNLELYKQGRFLGLSNAQIEQEIQARADASNPFKTAFKQKIMQDIVGPKILGIMANIAKPGSGQAIEEAGKRITKFQLMDLSKITDDEERKKLIEQYNLDKQTIAQSNADQIAAAKSEAEKGFYGKYAMLSQLRSVGDGAATNLLSTIPDAQQQQFNKATNRTIDEGAVKNIVKDASNSSLTIVQSTMQYVSGFFDTALGKFIVGIGALGGAAAMHAGAAGMLMNAARKLAAASGIGPGPGKIGKKLIKGGVGAVAGGLVGYGLDVASEKAKKAGHEKTGQALDAASNIATLAGTGAVIGSIIPGVGTAVGAGVGAAAGAAWSLYDYLSKDDDTGKAAKAVTKPDIKPITQATTSFGQSNPISKIIANEPGKLTVQRPDGSVEVLSGSRNWRNNNPGNIEAGDFANKNGAIGSDGRFAIFPTYEVGDAARAALLKTGKSYSGKKLTDQISTYAPPSENNTAAYQATVLAAVNGKNVPFADYTPEEQTKILDAMKMHEGFKPGKIATITPGTGINTPIQTASITPSVVAKTTVSQPTTPSAASINTNADMLIAKNIETSNKHLANISRGIEQLILSSNSGRVGTPLQKIPQNSTEAYKPG